MTSIGGYRLQHLLGAGGMGAVYLAEHADRAVPVALKLLPRASRHGFEGEVAALAALSHPGVVQIVDRGVLDEDRGPWEAGTPWIAMERLDGDLERRPPRPDQQVEVLRQTLEALAYAHGSGLLHLDLKPSNLLWRGDAVVLADFGLARREAGSITHVSAAFAAPEQLADAPTGPWTDLYALGRTAAWSCGPDSPLHRWIETASAEDPADRFASAAQALRALDALAIGDAAHGAAPTPVAATRSRGEGAPLVAVSLPRVPWIEPSPTPPPSPPVRPLHRGAGLGVVQQRSLPLLGRETQQASLWRALRSAAAERRAVVVQLDGTSGSGRTSLGTWLARAAHADCGALVLELPSREDLAGALRLAVRRHPLGATADGLASTWLAGELPPSLALRGFQAWLGGRLAVVLAEHPSAAELAGVDSPLVVVGSGFEQAEVRVELPPLPVATIQAALGGLLGLDVPTANALARHARGNPGAALALVNHAVDTGALRPTEHGLAQIGPLQLPPRAIEPLRARFSRFSDDERRVLAMAAALGPEVRDADLPEPRASTLQRALAEGIWQRAGTRWAWASSALRQAALGCSGHSPVELHRACAERAHDPLQVGLHLAHAGDLAALPLLLQGFRDAIAHQDVEAAANAERAARALPVPVDEVRPALMTARLAWTQNQDQRAVQALARVEPHLDSLDPDGRNDFHLVHGNVRTNHMQLDEALASYDRVQLEGSSTHGYHLAHGRARALGWSHREREALQVVDDALSDPSLTLRQRHDLLLVRGTTLHTLQRLDEAEQTYRLLLQATPVLAYQAASNLADLLRQRGDTDGSRTAYDEATRLAAAAGTELSFATVCAPTLDAVFHPAKAYAALREAIAATTSDAVAAFGHLGCLHCCPDGSSWDEHWDQAFHLLPRLPSDPDSAWFLERAREHALRRGWTARADAVRAALEAL